MKAAKKLSRKVFRGFGKPHHEPATDDEDEQLVEVPLRYEIPGSGGTPVEALVPREALSEIARGDREVETRLQLQDRRHGWRVMDVSVMPREDRESPKRGRRVMQKIPGHGRVPLRMAFLENVEDPDPKRRAV